MDVSGADITESDGSAGDTGSEPNPGPPASAEPDVDLERIADDLADVELALERLEAGSYWNDEITGEPLSDDELADDPTGRRRVKPTEPAHPTEPAQPTDHR